MPDAPMACFMKNCFANGVFETSRSPILRAAIDQLHVKPDAAIAGAREIAFFPPMTGG